VERATQLFHRDGFVVVRDALTPEQLVFLKAGCLDVVRDMMGMDKNRRGNRGSHRYSFDSSSRTGQLLHRPERAMLVDLPAGVTFVCPAPAGSVLIYDGLSDHGKKFCQYIVADKGDVLETGCRKDLGKTPRLLQREFQDHIS
jgi:hypothetical protein